MVSKAEIKRQLKAIGFGGGTWNQAEIKELPKIIQEGEVISECVNGFYEGGVALLVATELRLLLVDKKPLNFLNIEDLRFDMINEIDYNHRLMGAQITISTGSKTLKFKSYNQHKLRHLISLVQQHMSASKRDVADTAQNQQQHLEAINKQLQMYLLAQHNQLVQMGQLPVGSSQPSMTQVDAEVSATPSAAELAHDAKREVYSRAMPSINHSRFTKPSYVRPLAIGVMGRMALAKR